MPSATAVEQYLPCYCLSPETWQTMYLVLPHAMPLPPGSPVPTDQGSSMSRGSIQQNLVVLDSELELRPNVLATVLP